MEIIILKNFSLYQPNSQCQNNTNNIKNSCIKNGKELINSSNGNNNIKEFFSLSNQNNNNLNNSIIIDNFFSIQYQ